MIVVNLKGGLGNQMFQYALGRKLSLKNGDALKLDTEGLARANEVGDIYRPFSLDRFSIQAGVATPEEARKLKYPYGPLSKLVRRFRFKVLRQMHVGYEPGLLRTRGNAYLDGYFQSPKYFDDIRATLLEDYRLRGALSPAASAFAARMQETNSVSVHVRRGDYTAAQNADLGPCSLSYYQKAVARIQEAVPEATWFVFSDDIAWVRENLELPGESVYVSGNGIIDQEEVLLMASCKHNVIANSSFSWWGAWLNQNPGKMVIAPDPWFDTNKSDHKDLIPDAWIRIPKN